jgi:hypothetical protein
MRWLVDHRVGARPGEVEPESVMVEDHAEPFEWIEDLDPVGAHLLNPAVVTKSIGHADRELPVSLTDGGVGVDDPEVRIDPETGDQKNLAGPVMGVQVTTIVGVAVAGHHVSHGQRYLVHGVFVEGHRHEVSLRAQVGSSAAERLFILASVVLKR